MDIIDIFQKALDELEEGIYILDTDLRIKFINKAGEKFLDVKREDIVGKISDECFGYPPNDVRLVEKTIEKGVEFVVDVLPYKWGKYDRFMKVQTKILRGNGQIIGAMAIFMDITQSVKLLSEEFLARIIPSANHFLN
jgi:rsbT co-antagonist protein RsbR